MLGDLYDGAERYSDPVFVALISDLMRLLAPSDSTPDVGLFGAVLVPIGPNRATFCIFSSPRSLIRDHFFAV